MYGLMQTSVTSAVQALGCAQWYAVMTRPRHEKKVAKELEQNSVVSYLPLATELRRWSDRQKKVELPLFPGYIFVRLVPTAQNKVSVLRLGGVLHFVGASGHGAPILRFRDRTIRTILSHNVPVTPTGFLRVGQRVRIRGGALDGVEGVLSECGRRLGGFDRCHSTLPRGHARGHHGRASLDWKPGQAPDAGYDRHTTKVEPGVGRGI